MIRAVRAGASGFLGRGCGGRWRRLHSRRFLNPLSRDERDNNADGDRLAFADELLLQAAGDR